MYSSKRNQILTALSVVVATGCMLLTSAVGAFEQRRAPVDIYCGQITRIAEESAAVDIVSMDAALKRKEFKHEGSVAEDITEERSPQNNDQYVIVTVNVEPGYSIGISDYDVEANGETYECLGARMAGNEVFDPRLQEISANRQGKRVDLLYELPKGAEEVSLRLTYDLRVVKGRIPLHKQQAEQKSASSTDEKEGESQDQDGTGGQASEKGTTPKEVDESTEDADDVAEEKTEDKPDPEKGEDKEQEQPEEKDAESDDDAADDTEVETEEESSENLWQ